MEDAELLVECIEEMIGEVIRKTGKGYTLYTKHGKKRKLNKKPKSLPAVKAQERAIHAHGG